MVLLANIDPNSAFCLRSGAASVILAHTLSGRMKLRLHFVVDPMGWFCMSMVLFVWFYNSFIIPKLVLLPHYAEGHIPTSLVVCKCSHPVLLITAPIKGVVHFKKKKLLLIIYSPPCHPRCPCHSFFSQKEMNVFDENIPGFFSI